MRWIAVVVVVGILFAVGSPGNCGATRYRQVVPGGRVADAALSPKDGSVAYIEYGRKHFDESGARYAFDVVVGHSKGGAARALLRVPPAETKDGPRQARIADVRWLRSGRYVLALRGPYDKGGWLLAPDGSLATKVGRHGDWFVTNDEVDLTWHEAMAVNGYLRSYDSVMGESDPWLWYGIGPMQVHRQFVGCAARIASPLTGPQFAALRLPAQPLRGPGVTWAVGGQRRSGAPRVVFTCGDPASRITSADGRHTIYIAGDGGDPDGESHSAARHLWVQRSDGRGRRLLARDVSYWHQWLDDEWVVYSQHAPADGGASGVMQLGIINVRTERGQLLTAGRYHHILRDYRDGRFLVTEHALGKDGEGYSAHKSRLYIIEPLRVRM